MGTSCLESARLGVPTLLINNGDYFDRNSSYIYSFRELGEGDLGGPSTFSETHYVLNLFSNKSHQEIKSELITLGNIGLRQFETKHSENIIYERLLGYLSNSSALVESLGNFNFIKIFQLENILIMLVYKLLRKKRIPFYDY